ncbi:hypothetical protein EX30DRAFT_339593 [Ascodesmis nigricans]|uniref:Uncharacterized protein n=1 Tax=Ascodesmis nigricans TaxID=341454 RepID=A0A4S2N2X1_9PEZI|nr:hypothetical protein EX30DRAFT_339593 [Ascodesmis nigricans]
MDVGVDEQEHFKGRGGFKNFCIRRSEAKPVRSAAVGGITRIRSPATARGHSVYVGVCIDGHPEDRQCTGFISAIVSNIVWTFMVWGVETLMMVEGRRP